MAKSNKLSTDSAWERFTEFVGADKQIQVSVQVGMRLSLNYDSVEVQASVAVPKASADLHKTISLAASALREQVATEAKRVLVRAKTVKREIIDEGIE